VLSRVILLSDGCANDGLTEVPQIAAHVSELAQAGVTTSTYGLGRHFNEALTGACGRAAEHPWVAAVVAELETLARQRDELLFAKEARYSAMRMNSRLAAARESAAFEQESSPSYLQRKRSQGQSRERRPPQPPSR
jgi:Ca-activated chloride channel family protein